MGDVAIIDGIATVAIGLVIVLIVVPIYGHEHRGDVFRAGIPAIVLDHVGWIVGAIYVDRVEVVLCYVTGMRLSVAAVRGVMSHDS